MNSMLFIWCHINDGYLFMRGGKLLLKYCQCSRHNSKMKEIVKIKILKVFRQLFTKISSKIINIITNTIMKVKVKQHSRIKNYENERKVIA